MAFIPTGIFADLANMMPSTQDIVQQAIIGAGVTTVLAGAKTQAGQDALDPFGLFHKHDPSPASNPNNIVGPTATAAALNAMSPAAVAGFWAAGGHVVG